MKIAREKKDFSNIKCLERDLSFYGSGAILHELFFENMGPAIPTEPDIELMQQIIKDFGSYEIFKEQFTEASKAVEAVGRNPEAEGKIRTMMILGIALTETVAIYGLLISIILIFVFPALYL